MNAHEWPCRIKSARRKKRLVKTDRDKQLIQLYKRLQELHQQQLSMPLVPLQSPYQSGWKRTFVLRDDVRDSKQAEFYTALLATVNTVQYNAERVFKRKKRRRRRYGYELITQLLQEFNEREWNVNWAKLTDEQKACFTRVESYSLQTKGIEVKYVVTEPWRFVLKIVPHMITHTKLIDADIERELSYIDNYIDGRAIYHRIERLTRGKSYPWNKLYTQRAKYINRIKNLPRYSNIDAYQDLKL
ncbi:hypothetical protein IM792_11855 [Mucilaginibacter sp. JRF]|uniref:hypothetical protein n=1 Tax=Mucilaginibacter sp. JRF TaxID=2780088 RepID=UPI001881CF7E|nr:hypothetical protein [Mucilaginibacter sp. JRF]MBE9585145.1 hypothetical protein [Mucilaginibacter sp. JRF]